MIMNMCMLSKHSVWYGWGANGLLAKALLFDG